MRHQIRWSSRRIRANARMAWCAAWNRAIKEGLRPIEALRLADAAEAAAIAELKGGAK